MSSVLSLYTIPDDPDEFTRWSFAHMAHHRDINRRIFELVQFRLDEYIFDPFDPQNQTSMGVWLYQHQLAHNQQNAILGIRGQNLSDADLSQRDIFVDWIYSNADEHYQAATLLGIG